MHFNRAKQILESNGYTLEPLSEGAFGDWAERFFRGETRLGQAIYKMQDKTAKYFAGLIAGCMSSSAKELANYPEFVKILIDRCEDLADRVRSVASKKPKGETAWAIERLLRNSFYSIMQELGSYDNIINFKDKVFSSRYGDSEFVRWGQKYSEQFGK